LIHAKSGLQMSEHFSEISWANKEHVDQPTTYSRDLEIRISEKVSIAASAAADYLGDPAKADPEQLLVSAVASCHMLYFLALCEGQGYVVKNYDDLAKGIVTKQDGGGYWVSEIVLKPRVEFDPSKVPDQTALERLHHRAHKGCFIANSIKTKVAIELN